MGWVQELVLAAVSLAPLFLGSYEGQKAAPSKSVDAQVPEKSRSEIVATGADAQTTPVVEEEPEDIPYELQLEFEQGVEYLRAQTKFKMSNQAKLTFYALYKVAHQGRCNIPRPSLLEQVAYAKWEMWRKYEHLSRAQAMEEYMRLLRGTFQLDDGALRVLPPKPAAPAKTNTDDQEGDQDDDEVDADDAEQHMGIAISRPMISSEEAAELRADGDKDVFDWLSLGHTTKVLSMLPDDVDVVDENGWTLLHVAADRGNDKVISELLKANARFDMCDDTGRTPLYYAVLAEHPRCVQLLLAAGGDPLEEDDDGTPLVELTTNPDVVKMLKQAAGQQF